MSDSVIQVSSDWSTTNHAEDRGISGRAEDPAYEAAVYNGIIPGISGVEDPTQSTSACTF